jgi:L-cysteine/cystine lyase
MFGEVRITSGPAAGKTIVLDKAVFIGRSEDGVGGLGGDPSIARRHARILPTGRGSILVVDMGSESGSWVNGERVATREVATGDVVRFGAVTLEVVAPASRGGIRREQDSEAKARALRAEFPVFDRFLYLNAGMAGPVPTRGIAAAQAQCEIEVLRGRSGNEHWDNILVLFSRLRERYARALGCSANEVALTRATTDGVNAVLGGLRFAAGDEILTTDEEHQGVYAPLAAMRERHGCRIRIAPFDDLANAVTSETRLVACSHVSWRTGRIIDTKALKASGVPFLLDGAQALGAVACDVRDLGCDFYAASGHKWLCGPDRSGCLYVRPDRIEDLSPPVTSNYWALEDRQRPLDLVLARGAARFDPGNLPGSVALWALAALDVLEEAGLAWVTDRGPALAGELAGRLRDAGLEIEPRGASTLVSFRSDDAARVVGTLEADGILVRDVPGRVRISVGAWCLSEDIDRVVDGVVRAARSSNGPR